MGYNVYFLGRVHCGLLVGFLLSFSLLLQLVLGLEDNLRFELNIPHFSLRWDIQRNLLLSLGVLCVNKIENTVELKRLDRHFPLYGLPDRLSLRRLSHRIAQAFLRTRGTVHWWGHVMSQARLCYQLEFNAGLVLQIVLDWVIVVIVAIDARHGKLFFLRFGAYCRLQEEDGLVFEIPHE